MEVPAPPTSPAPKTSVLAPPVLMAVAVISMVKRTVVSLPVLIQTTLVLLRSVPLIPVSIPVETKCKEPKPVSLLPHPLPVLPVLPVDQCVIKRLKKKALAVTIILATAVNP